MVGYLIVRENKFMKKSYIIISAIFCFFIFTYAAEADPNTTTPRQAVTVAQPNTATGAIKTEKIKIIAVKRGAMADRRAKRKAEIQKKLEERKAEIAKRMAQRKAEKKDIEAVKAKWRAEKNADEK